MLLNNNLNDYLTPATVSKAARFILSLEPHAFEKKSFFSANKLRAVLKQAFQTYTEPCLPVPRLSWILRLEQEVAILLRLIRTLYPLLTVSTRAQLIAQLGSPSSPVYVNETAEQKSSLPFEPSYCLENSTLNARAEICC